MKFRRLKACHRNTGHSFLCWKSKQKYQIYDLKAYTNQEKTEYCSLKSNLQTEITLNSNLQIEIQFSKVHSEKEWPVFVSCFDLTAESWVDSAEIKLKSWDLIRFSAVPLLDSSQFAWVKAKKQEHSTECVFKCISNNLNTCSLAGLEKKFDFRVIHKKI